jgi:hypothetical protein
MTEMIVLRGGQLVALDGCSFRSYYLDEQYKAGKKKGQETLNEVLQPFRRS